jgi:arylsulfatase A-like enzyme
MGNEYIKTPNCDQLARDGVLFENAFHSSPICEPSRASIMLSQHLSKHQCGFDRPTDRSISFAEFSKSYPVSLRKAGYRTGFVGKFGFPVTKEKIQNVQYPNGKRDYRTQLWKQDKYMPVDEFDEWHGHSGQGSYDVNGQHRTEYNGDKACEFISDCAQNHPDQPFCLSVSFKAPHGPLQPDKKYLDMYQDMHIPRQPTDNLDHFNLLPEVVREGYRGRNGYPTDKNYQHFIKSYYALISGVDVVVGRIRKTLKDNNLAQNTVIIYTSDNGFFCGSKRLKGKDLLYTESLRAPLIVYDPRLKPELAGRRLDGLVSVVDYAPTILDLAGLNIPKSMQGVSFVPMIKNKKKIVRKSIFAENNFASFEPTLANANNQQEKRKILLKGTVRSKCVRTKKFKYIRYHETKPIVEELFAIEQDRLETNNLAQDPNYRSTLQKMRDLCDQYMAKM